MAELEHRIVQLRTVTLQTAMIELHEDAGNNSIIRSDSAFVLQVLFRDSQLLQLAKAQGLGVPFPRT
jgi:hypothetical protein